MLASTCTHGQPGLRPGPKIPSQAGSGLHFGLGSSLIFEPSVGLGRTWAFNFVCFSRARLPGLGFLLIQAGFGPELHPTVGPGQAQAWLLTPGFLGPARTLPKFKHMFHLALRCLKRSTDRVLSLKDGIQFFSHERLLLIGHLRLRDPDALSLHSLLPCWGSTAWVPFFSCGSAAWVLNRGVNG
jgi:hypothetical protein